MLEEEGLGFLQEEGEGGSFSERGLYMYLFPTNNGWYYVGPMTIHVARHTPPEPYPHTKAKDTAPKVRLIHHQ